MANTFSQIYIQTVFAVSGRMSLITGDYKEELHKYIAGIVRNKRQKLLPDQRHVGPFTYSDWVATGDGSGRPCKRYQVGFFRLD
jgi:hypothetical protein